MSDVELKGVIDGRFEIAGAAESGVGQVDVDPQQGVLTTLDPRPRPTPGVEASGLAE